MRHLKNNEGIFSFEIVFVIIVTIIAIALTLAITTWRDSEVEKELQWEKNIQECPMCNWSGYGGAMKIHEGIFVGENTYYCPQCGYRVKG